MSSSTAAPSAAAGATGTPKYLSSRPYPPRARKADYRAKSHATQPAQRSPSSNQNHSTNKNHKRNERRRRNMAVTVSHVTAHHRPREDDNDDAAPDRRRHRHHSPEAHAEAVTSASSATPTAAVQAMLPLNSVATCVLPLDAKLIELLYCLSPTSDERAGKLRVIEQVRQALQRAGLDIQIYGSLCTGLVIPASDVDCVMMRSSEPDVAAAISASLSNALLSISSAATGSLPPRSVRAALSTAIRTASDRMRRHAAFAQVTCIAHAKVPIVKCRHRAENVKVDLSFEKDGCVSSNYLCELFCEPGNELARPLIVLVKGLVHHAGLDDPSVGGLGSFPISMLVLWYLQHRVRARFAPELQHSLAVLLVGFLQYYGSEFDFRHEGIDYVRQRAIPKAAANDLFIVNPIRPGKNCAGAAKLFAPRVVPLFQSAAEALVPLLVLQASSPVVEERLLHFFAKALRGVRDWRDVSREAAQNSHLPQNMWDQATNLYMGGVL